MVKKEKALKKGVKVKMARKLCMFCNRIFGKRTTDKEKCVMTLCEICERKFLKEIKDENDKKKK
jgi:hypothetical protein